MLPVPMWTYEAPAEEGVEIVEGRQTFLLDID